MTRYATPLARATVVLCLCAALILGTSLPAAAALRIDITGKSVDDIKAEIEAALAAGDVVVTGAATVLNETLVLDIPEDRAVIWRAGYNGTVAGKARDAKVMIVLYGDGVFTVAAGGSVVTDGEYCIAIYSDLPAVSVLSGGTVCASGDFAHGIFSRKKGVTVNGGTVSVIGDFCYGIFVSTGDLTLDGGKVTVNGIGCNGLYAYNDSVIVSDSSVTVSGEDSVGIVADHGDVTVTRNSFVTAAGNNSVGIQTYGSAITVNDSTVVAVGAGSAAIDPDSGPLYLTGAAAVFNPSTGR